MLAVLRIKNFAIVELLEVEFAPGLNVITGETGAGKSILLKALELLGGARASTDVIRHGAERCEIEGLFRLSAETRAAIEAEWEHFADRLVDDELLVRRVIDQSGRGKIYLNGSLSTAGELQQLFSLLMEITSQHAQVLMLEPNEHRRLLDVFGVSEELREKVRVTYLQFAQLAKRLSTLEEQSGRREEYIKRLTDERDELRAAELGVDEEERIEQEISRLGSVEQLGALVSEALQLLEDDERGIDTQVGRLRTLVERAAELDPTVEPLSASISDLAIALGETDLALSRYAQGLEVNPEKLELLRERLSELRRLTRKYQRDLPTLMSYLSQIEAELDDYSSGGFDIESVRSELAKLRAELTVDEQALTDARKLAAAALTKKVTRGLAELGMKQARFRVDISAKESSVDGADNVEFMLAANPGEDFRALKRVASGGELSRILLVLRTLESSGARETVHVFDEVDSGVGGAVAQVVGEKLKSVSKKAQVILVTHAPQIAAFADRHFHVAKEVVANSTRASVCVLTAEATVHEIARMLAGRKVTANFEDSARELLHAAGAIISRPTA